MKEDDRVRQIEAINAQTGPVMMAYRDAPALDALIAAAATGTSDVDVTADDGVRHQMWVVSDAKAIAALTDAFDALPAVYIADGHHRSAAAARVAEARGNKGSAAWFLTVTFSADEMTILDYNRVVRDLNGMEPPQLLAGLTNAFTIEPAESAVHPSAPGEFGMFLAGRWYRLTILPGLVSTDDPIGRLPISLLTDNLIAPLLGIADQRKDKRIDFVGGGRGLKELERRVASGEMAVAFALFPTSMADLMAIADAGEIMPPKSTWFEPKLADGMVSYVLD